LLTTQQMPEPHLMHCTNCPDIPRDLRSSYISKGPAQVWNYYTDGQLPMYIPWSPAEIKTPNTLEPDRPQRNSPTACVIAQ